MGHSSFFLKTTYVNPDNYMASGGSTFTNFGQIFFIFMQISEKIWSCNGLVQLLLDLCPSVNPGSIPADLH